jgi:hypothetical protein
MTRKQRSLVGAVISLGLALSLCTVAARTQAETMYAYLSTGSNSSVGWTDCLTRPSIVQATADGFDADGVVVCGTADYQGSTQSDDGCNNAVSLEAILEDVGGYGPPNLHVQGFSSWPNQATAGPVQALISAGGQPANCTWTTVSALAWGQN